MRNYVIINEVNSLTIQGLAINILPPITKPLIRSQIEEIDGRDGDIITELGYSAYDKSMEIGLWGEYDIDAIIKYFTGEGTIIFSTEPDKFYYYKILNQIDYDKLLKFKKATVTLHCQPFKYPVEETPIEGEAITVTGSGSNITLQNTVVAPIEMKLYGNTSQTGTPTPDSPQPIHTVSGDNSINVCGKNLAYTNWASEFVSRINNSEWASITSYDNRNCLLFASRAGYGDYDNKYVFKTNWQENTSYTFSFYEYIDDSFTGLAVEYTDGTYDRLTRENETVPAWQHITFTSNSSKTIKYLRCHWQGTSKYIDLNTFQVEKGTTATTYEPYQSNSYDIDLKSKNLWPLNGMLFTNWGSANTDIVALLNSLDEGTYTLILKARVKTLTTTQTTYRWGIYANGSGFGIEGRNNLTQTLKVGDLISHTVSITINSTNKGNFTNAYTYTISSTSGSASGIVELEGTQLEKGTTTDFVPYYDYGELCKIGTYQDRIFKSTGKNLIDLKKFLIDKNTTYTENSEGNYTIQGRTELYSQPYIFSDTDIPVSLNGIIDNGTATNVRIQLLNSSDSVVGEITSSVNKAENKNACKLRFNWSTNGTFTLKNIMLNTGETALPYEPYGTDWYVEKKIGKVVYTGASSENWTTGDYGTNSYKILLNNPANITNVYMMISNIFKGVAYSERAVAGNNIVYYDLNNAYVRNTSYTSLADFKTMLGTNNMTLYYILNTPTYTKIEGTLKEQLESLKPHSYNPTTNITQDNNDAPFELDVSLSYTNTMNVNNIGNIYAKPILTLEGSGNIGIILNDIEILSVDLGEGGKIAIDVPNLQAYDPDDDTLLNRLVTGDYMKLLIQEGDNTIAFSGSVTHATLEKYTRWI